MITWSIRFIAKQVFCVHILISSCECRILIFSQPFCSLNSLILIFVKEKQMKTIKKKDSAKTK